MLLILVICYCYPLLISVTVTDIASIISAYRYKLIPVTNFWCIFLFTSSILVEIILPVLFFLGSVLGYWNPFLCKDIAFKIWEKNVCTNGESFVYQYRSACVSAYQASYSHRFSRQRKIKSNRIYEAYPQKKWNLYTSCPSLHHLISGRIYAATTHSNREMAMGNGHLLMENRARQERSPAEGALPCDAA